MLDHNPSHKVLLKNVYTRTQETKTRATKITVIIYIYICSPCYTLYIYNPPMSSPLFWTHFGVYWHVCGKRALAKNTLNTIILCIVFSPFPQIANLELLSHSLCSCILHSAKNTVPNCLGVLHLNR